MNPRPARASRAAEVGVDGAGPADHHVMTAAPAAGRAAAPPRLLGIDPGLRLTGYACVEHDPRSPAGVRVIEAGVLRFAPRQSVSDRLLELADDFASLADRLAPSAAAVERLYAHYKHPATAIVMGHARGVILLGIRRAALPLIELAPAEVKKAMTGSGRARKSQMQQAAMLRLGLGALPDPPDVADALAIACCGLWRLGAPAPLARK